MPPIAKYHRLKPQPVNSSETWTSSVPFYLILYIAMLSDEDALQVEKANVSDTQQQEQGAQYMLNAAQLTCLLQLGQSKIVS